MKGDIEYPVNVSNEAKSLINQVKKKRKKRENLKISKKIENSYRKKITKKDYVIGIL